MNGHFFFSFFPPCPPLCQSECITLETPCEFSHHRPSGHLLQKDGHRINVRIDLNASFDTKARETLTSLADVGSKKIYKIKTLKNAFTLPWPGVDTLLLNYQRSTLTTALRLLSFVLTTVEIPGPDLPCVCAVVGGGLQKISETFSIDFVWCTQ